MPLIGYHASHEQFAPRELLDFVRAAEHAGFDAAMCSDHFHPWSEAQGQSGHAWSWLGSAMTATQLPFAVVNCPVGRYHPAVIAQAVATLLNLHGERFTLVVGSGEALNEAITGATWPAKDVRNRRLQTAVEVMRALWRGEEVTRRDARLDGFAIERARLYTRPREVPKVFVAALSAETARWAGDWADGLATISMPSDKLRSVVDAFREGGGEHKPMVQQVKLSYAPTDDEALRGAHAQWRTNVFPGEVSEELRTPAQFEAAAAHVQPEDMREAVRISSDPAQHVAWLQEDLALGFDPLYLHNVNRGQQRFIEDFGARVLPQLR